MFYKNNSLYYSFIIFYGFKQGKINLLLMGFRNVFNILQILGGMKFIIFIVVFQEKNV